MSIEIGLTPDSRWEVDASLLAEAVRQAGFTLLGLGSDLVDTDTAAVFRRAGLRCHELLALVVTDDSEATFSWAQRLVEKVALIQPQWVLTVFQTGLDNATAQTVRRCAAMFADVGAKMAVEFSPLGPVSSIPLGLEVVDAAGPERAGLIIDTWHFSFGESSWGDLKTVPLDRIAYIQFDDALAAVSNDFMQETLHRRVMPGDGVLELDRFATTLLSRGWEGAVSVEVLSSELRKLPISEFAQRAYESAARYWR